MKNNIPFFSFCLLLTLNAILDTTAFAQPPVSGIECSYCKGKNGNHKSSCRYYNPPASSGSSNISSNANFEQEIAQEILGNMITNLFRNAGKQSEEEKQRQKRQEELAKAHLAAMEAKQKKYNDSVLQVKHDKMKKEMKPLEGYGNVAYKSLENPKPKVNFNCKITGFKGEVKILKANGGGLITLSDNQSIDLAPGDYIAAGDNSQVKLHYAFEKGGEDILLGQNTIATIVTEEDGTQIPKLIGKKGRMYETNNKVSDFTANMNEKVITEIKELTKEARKALWQTENQKLRVRCANWAMAVRGTEFFLITDSLENSNVFVLNGMVDVIDEVNSKYVTLTTGYMCTVSSTGVISGILNFKIEEQNKWWLE